jgi:hypothetical protein
MTIWRVQQAFVPQGVSVPMTAVSHDWHGNACSPAAEVALVVDPACLWLLARRASPARPDPGARLGDFREGLWQHDVAELFIAAADRQRYLEFNVSPNGAWWFAGFAAPRERIAEHCLPEIRTEAFAHAAGGWAAALGIPLDFLNQHVAWGPDSALNVTLILDSPDQRFLTATDLGHGAPDFHRPERFSAIEWQDLPSPL